MQSDTEDRPGLESLTGALEGSTEDLRTFLETVHSADLAEWVVDLERRDLRRVLYVLQVEDLSELLRFAEDTVCEVLLDELNIEQIVHVVKELPADEVVDLLSHVDEQRAESVLRSVDFDRAQGLRKLARYDEESAGGLMTTEYVAVASDAHIGDAIKLIRNEEGPAAEEGGGVFVVDETGRPVGHLSDRELLTTPIHTPVSEVMESDLITVEAEQDQEEVAQLVRKYDFDAVPVVDSEGVLVGVVSADDAQEVLAEETEEDILRIVGASPQELQTRLPILTRVRHRLPLQGLTVLGGLATAAILDFALPDGVSGGATDILRYLPIIIGLAGNVGVQSSTILVRAMATGELVRERERSVLASETLVGVVIGIICGLLTMGVAGVLEDSMPDPRLFAGAVGGAIAVAVSWAAFLGGAVPIACVRMGIDPAIVAGPFLITLSDISGAAIFIGVASVVLGLGAEAVARERLGRLLWIAFGLVLLILCVKFFVADVYRVNSGSMRPTIFAGPLREGEEPLEEWVLVSYGLAPVPERFDLVVWDRGGVGAVVKRVVGLPGESVRIGDGDLWIDGARLPADAPRPVPVTVFDSRLSPVEDYFHFRSTSQDGPWSRAGDEWFLEALEVPAEKFLGMMSYHPELRDDYLDAAGRRVVGKRTINDAVIECEFRIEEGDGRLRFLLIEKADTFELRISQSEPGAANPHLLEILRRSSVEQQGEDAQPQGVLASATADLARDAWHRVRFSNVDDHLIVELGDGVRVLVHSYERNELQPGRAPDSDHHVGPRVEFGADGLNVRFRSLRIARDLHYISSEGGRGVEQAEHLGPGEVFLLGDNSAQSQDSRTFGPVPVGELIGAPRCVVWPLRMARVLHARR